MTAKTKREDFQISAKETIEFLKKFIGDHHPLFETVWVKDDRVRLLNKSTGKRFTAKLRGRSEIIDPNGAYISLRSYRKYRLKDDDTETELQADYMILTLKGEGSDKEETMELCRGSKYNELSFVADPIVSFAMDVAYFSDDECPDWTINEYSLDCLGITRDAEADCWCQELAIKSRNYDALAWELNKKTAKETIMV